MVMTKLPMYFMLPLSITCVSQALKTSLQRGGSAEETQCNAIDHARAKLLFWIEVNLVRKVTFFFVYLIQNNNKSSTSLTLSYIPTILIRHLTVTCRVLLWILRKIMFFFQHVALFPLLLNKHKTKHPTYGMNTGTRVQNSGQKHIKATKTMV